MHSVGDPLMYQEFCFQFFLAFLSVQQEWNYNVSRYQWINWKMKKDVCESAKTNTTPPMQTKILKFLELIKQKHVGRKKGYRFENDFLIHNLLCLLAYSHTIVTNIISQAYHAILMFWKHCPSEKQHNIFRIQVVSKVTFLRTLVSPAYAFRLLTHSPNKSRSVSWWLKTNFTFSAYLPTYSDDLWPHLYLKVPFMHLWPKLKRCSLILTTLFYDMNQKI